MAQLPREGAEEKMRRLGRRLRRRPLTVAAIMAVAVLVAVAVLLGTMQARNQIIPIVRGERVESGSADVAARRGERGSAKRRSRSNAAGSGAGDADAASEAGDDRQVVVDVSGAVAAPAVVRLEAGARVADAIAAAGGLASDADVTALNRAAKVADGDKVYVPHQGEAAASTPAGGQQTGAGRAPAGPVALVNINTAGVDELNTLPGVGPSTAQAIVDDRTQNGPFSGIEDIMRVSGIGEKKFEKLKSKICA